MSRQPDLFDFEAYARRTDPHTSHAAAATVEVAKLEGLVLAALRAWGPMTSREVCARIGRDPWSISPRFKPLETKGLIEKHGTKAGLTKRQHIVWKAKPQKEIDNG